MRISDGKSDGEGTRKKKSDFSTETPSDSDGISFRRKIRRKFRRIPSEFPGTLFKKILHRVFKVLGGILRYFSVISTAKREEEWARKREREQGRERRRRTFVISGGRKNFVSSLVI